MCSVLIESLDEEYPDRVSCCSPTPEKEPDHIAMKVDSYTEIECGRLGERSVRVQQRTVDDLTPQQVTDAIAIAQKLATLDTRCDLSAEELSLDIERLWLSTQRIALSEDRTGGAILPPDIRSPMLTILFDWLTGVMLRFKLRYVTFFQACYITKNVLSTDCFCNLSRNELQLLGMACMHVCAKMNEVRHPEVADYVYICDKAYDARQVTEMEQKALVALAYSIAPETHYSYCESLAHICLTDQTKLEQHLQQYICFCICTFLHEIMCQRPIHLALAALCIARYSIDDSQDLRTCNEALWQVARVSPDEIQNTLEAIGEREPSYSTSFAEARRMFARTHRSAVSKIRWKVPPQMDI